MSKQNKKSDIQNRQIIDKSFIDEHEIIDKIEISSEGITFFIDIQTIPMGMSSYPKVKIKFCEVESYYLEGEIYGCASIILDMQFIFNIGTTSNK